VCVYARARAHVLASAGWVRARGWCARTLFLISLLGDCVCER
jgi:hypothetical protein